MTVVSNLSYPQYKSFAILVWGVWADYKTSNQNMKDKDTVAWMGVDFHKDDPLLKRLLDKPTMADTLLHERLLKRAWKEHMVKSKEK